jgi:hypothetical protein
MPSATNSNFQMILMRKKKLPSTYGFSKAISFVFQIMSDVSLPWHTMPSRDCLVWLPSPLITHHSELLCINLEHFLKSRLRKTISIFQTQSLHWKYYLYPEPRMALIYSFKKYLFHICWGTLLGARKMSGVQWTQSCLHRFLATGINHPDKHIITSFDKYPGEESWRAMGA